MAYYAVAKGREGPSIYHTWTECEANVKGFSGAIYKKFPTERDAKAFIVEKSGSREEDIEKQEKVKKEDTKSSNSLLELPINDDAILKIFIDGACANNGKTGAKAGYACYFPDYPEYGQVQKLAGLKQTNNRAEYSALLLAHKRAKEVISLLNLPISELLIYSDSLLLCKSINVWMKRWKARGWKKRNGKEVLNVDLLKKIDRLTFPYKIQHVRAHTDGDDYFSVNNAIVDGMANRVVGM